MEPEGHDDRPELPAPTLWPVGFAVGIAVLLIGIVVSTVVAVVGGVIAAIFAFLWIRDLTTAHRKPVEVEETRAEVDQLAYKLLELREGIPASFQGFAGGMGGGWGGMGSPWFGSIGVQPGGGMR